MPLEPIDLLRLNLSLRFSLPSPTRLASLEPVAGDPVPRLHVARLPQGYALHFHHGTPQRLIEYLTALGPDRLFGQPEAMKDLLGNDGWSGRRWTGCSNPIASAHIEGVSPMEGSPEVRRLGRRFEIWEGGRAVAWAWSVRENARAAEVAVGIASASRGDAVLPWAVGAWANDILRAGKVAFYSWGERDIGSEGLARKLGAEWFATSLAYL